MREILFNQIKEMGFDHLRISLTKDCNGVCHFCHNEGQKKGLLGDKALPHVAILNLNDYEYMASFFKSYFKSVTFTGGEPTLVQNLPEIVHIFKKEGYQTKLVTNGFLLTNELQQRLKLVGLDWVHLTLPTLNPVQHGALFNVGDKFATVMKNFENLVHHFKGHVKINFMALPDVTVPNELIPLSNLSAKWGVPICFLTTLENSATVAEEVLTYLQDHIGQVWEENETHKHQNKQICYFENGAVWEFYDFRQEEYRKTAFLNAICKDCPVKERCIEGPYALRVTETGDLRPCLIREDNIILFQENGYVNERAEHLSTAV